MTLVMIEGFTGALPGAGSNKPWDAGGTLYYRGGRDADPGGCHLGEFGYFRYSVAAAEEHATMIAGCATRNPNGSAFVLMQMQTPGGVGILDLELFPGVGGWKIRVRRVRDGIILAESATELVDNAAWYYVEFKVIVGVSGSFEVKTNEVTRLSGSAIDTLPASGTLVGKVKYGPPIGANSYIQYDDLYICNGAGTVNNNFIGDTNVYLLFPTAAGDLSQFTPTPNTAANWQNVDDVAVATDYNEATVILLTDLYNFADLPASAAGRVVHGVIAWTRLLASVLPKSGAMVTRLSAVNEVEGPTIVLTTAGTYYRMVQETKPGGGAWATADVNTAQHGVRVKS